MKVVRLDRNDLTACVELGNLAVRGLWSEMQWDEELSSNDSICLGVKEISVLLAMSCGHVLMDEFHLYLIAVHPSYRRIGLGRELLVALLRKAYKLGACQATLEVSSLNLDAYRFYKEFGFEVRGFRRRYYQNGSDALILWSDLNKYAGSERINI